ncbi:hypothetical protein FLK61_29750 [Paenalkalicoccus suaedae]|uniref:DUF2802 domain-containing protein n=1 Tax=Paenalkalicoccus suaedae TaxID=2592382 RepID=A0A859FDD3_9BACI|nr:hypothetical protein [Paenalkalicoccus suaedae]QKS70910.1 hypothetical protein FLK61_29750 [Paenalkalicoccus suaedae]
MSWILIALFSVSALLFGLSFARKNPYKELERQMENSSIQMMQEIYYLRKKVETLEEELMVPGASAKESNRLSREDVLQMFEDGQSPREIASNTGFDADYIEDLLDGKVKG